MPELYFPSLDEAWLGAVEAACTAREHELSPLVVGFDAHGDAPPPQYIGLRPALDEALVAGGRATVETVANTLFPNSLWNPSKSRKRLFQRYVRILPALRRDSHNRRGIYFERLINYPGARGEEGKNQLDHIIETFNQGNHRRSALQAAILYPLADLTNSRQQGFPCLQQIAFAHNHNRGTLTITGFYAMQYLFERAYGNYLGLKRLGEFMAHEMSLTLERVICIAAVGKLDVRISEVEPLVSHFVLPLAAQM
jgi:hypothetical protein